MASDAQFVDYVMDQLSGLPGVSSRKMFGEYAIFCGVKLVALICDNQLFVKPTSAGRAHLGSPTEAPPYPGAKPSFLIRDELEDRDGLRTLVGLTAEELPLPKPKKTKKTKKPKRAKSPAAP